MRARACRPTCSNAWSAASPRASGATAARSASASRPACRCPTCGATRRPRERAITLFGKLRVWDTEHNNGVLIYLLLAEHAIEIVADRGIDRASSDAQWAAMAQRMGAAFREGRFEDGLTQALEEVSALLVEHFPLAEGADRSATNCPTRRWCSLAIVAPQEPCESSSLRFTACAASSSGCNARVTCDTVRSRRLLSRSRSASPVDDAPA